MVKDFHKVKKYCLVCGKRLKLHATRDIERTKYCSVQCRDKGHKNAMKGHSTSVETRNKMRIAAIKRGFGKASGVDHPNWTGSQTENRMIRSSCAYSEWRNSVYQRDHWTCQQCGQVGGGLHAHHILEFAKYPSLRLEINNGITLCEICHRRLHKRKVQNHG